MRKLAAIMFTDLVGYSALSQKNEALALELLEEHRKLLRPLFDQYNGQEIKTIGDAFLVEFTSAVEAARCAIDIQKTLTAHTSVVDPERRIQVRIGLHVGDVVIEKDDILGDGVNIASRIEPLAEPGGICLTAAVAEQVRNKIDCSLEKLGDRQLKNIKEPVTVYRIVLPWDKGKAPAKLVLRMPDNMRWIGAGTAALLLVVGAWWLISRTGPIVEPGQIRSIAVLPLDNLGGDPEQVYFVEGMHEALITELAKISALRVISRTSTLGFGGAGTSIPEIARLLDVDAIVEGSVLVVGERVRINAQLIDGRREQHLWAEAFERDLRDVLALQSEVAQAIAREIKITLKPDEEAYLASPRPVNPEAYLLYLKGWHFRNLESPESLMKAVEHLERAVAINPDFAQAWAALVLSHFLTGSVPTHYPAWGILTPEARLKAKGAAEKALALDPNLAVVQLYMGFYRYVFEWDWAGAEAAFRRALELNPGDMYAHYEYGLFLTRLGRHDEALPELERVVELSPLSHHGYQGVGTDYYWRGQFDQAVEWFEKALELGPSSLHIANMLGESRFHSLLQQGKFEELLQAQPVQPALVDRWRVMIVYQAMERRAEAQVLFDSLKAELQQLEADAISMAWLYKDIGDQEGALSWLETAYEERYTWLWLVATDPTWAALRSHPRFQYLLKKMGLE